jgi:hypothetical protein
MASKKKATASAPASKSKPAAKSKAKIPTSEPVVLPSIKEVQRLERIAKRAERSAANKAAYAANKAAAMAHAQSTVDSIRAIAGNKKFGQPPVPWTEELGDTLFELIATGHSMDMIGAMEGMPSVFNMLKWRQDETHPFSSLFSRAKQQLVDLYEERAQLAALQPLEFVIKTRKQVVTRDGDVVWVTERKIVDNTARSALQLQAYQWTLGHLKPKKHGRNPDQGGGGTNEQLKGLIDALKAGPAE